MSSKESQDNTKNPTAVSTVTVTVVHVLGESPKVEHIQHVLKDYAADYDRIGSILGLNYNARRTIDTDNVQYLGHEKKLNAIINQCLEEYPNKTWREFIEAFRKDKMNKLAAVIEEYLEREEIQDYYAERTSSLTDSQSPEEASLEDPVDVHKTFTLMKCKSAQWDKIGRGLGLSQNDRDNIKRERDDAESSLEAVLYKWEQINGRTATWRKLINALRKEELNDLADIVTQRTE